MEDNTLYHRTYSGGKTRIGVLYRRISDEYLDPLNFLPESLIGIPNLLEAYRSGNVGIINAPETVLQMTRESIISCRRS